MLDFGATLGLRGRYLDVIYRDFKGYRLDNRNQLRQYLTKSLGLNPIIHDVVSAVFDRRNSTNRERSPESDKYYHLFKKINQSLLAHLEFKKDNATSEKIVQLDIWLEALPEAKDEEQCRWLLNASDHLEDIVWLTSLFGTGQLSNDDIEMEPIVQAVLSEPLQYFDRIPTACELKDDACRILNEANDICRERNFVGAMIKIHELKSLIRSNYPS